MEKRTNGKELSVIQNEVPSLKANKGSFQAIEEFTQLLSQHPPKDRIQKTPDGKAETLPISDVESTLDEVYLRQWGDENVQVLQIANELCIWLTLWVIDPQTKMKITRTGFASIQIMVDKAPDSLTGKDRNQWALDMANKKPNALKMHWPAALSLARKNAAKTLGVIFGRNLNRKFEDTPDTFYTNEFEARETIDGLSERMNQCKTIDELKIIWQEFPNLQSNATFSKNFTYYKNKIAK